MAKKPSGPTKEDLLEALEICKEKLRARDDEYVSPLFSEEDDVRHATQRFLDHNVEYQALKKRLEELIATRQQEQDELSEALDARIAKIHTAILLKGPTAAVVKLVENLAKELE